MELPPLPICCNSLCHTQVGSDTESTFFVVDVHMRQDFLPNAFRELPAH